MTSSKRLWGLAAGVASAALALAACNGFGTNCSTDSDCQAVNPSAVCDPTLKVCFLYAGPTVTQIQPANQATDVVPLNADVVATFSEVIADSGVSDNFSLVGQGFVVPGGYLVTVDGGVSQATFVPLAGGLALGTDYTVFLDAGIVDLQGRPLLPFGSTFSTRDGVFTSGGSLRYATQTGLFSLADNYFGDVITEVTLYISGTTADFGVGAGVSASGAHPTANSTLQDVVGLQASNPSVGVADDGTGFAAWTNQTTTGPVSSVAVVAVWNPTSQSWSSAIELADAGADQRPAFPQVVGFEHARGLAVWIFQKVLYGEYYRADAGWGASFPIQTNLNVPANPAGTAHQLSLASDFAGGDALVAWTSAQETVDAGQILAAFLPSTANFPPPVPLSNSSEDSQLPQVAMGYGTAGNGAVVWQSETQPNVTHVFGSTFDPTRANPFSARVQLDDAILAIDPHVGVAANGNVIAIWQEEQDTPDGGTANAISSAIYTRASDSWSAPVTLDSDPSVAVYAPVIAVDPGGNALAAWLKGNDAGAVLPPGCYAPPLGCLVVKGGRYTADGGWREITQIGTASDPVFNFAIQVVVDGLGRGWVVDTRNPGNSTLYLEYIPFE